MRRLLAVIALLACSQARGLLAAEKAGAEITQGRATSVLQEISKKPLYVYSIRGRRDPFAYLETLDPRAIQAESGEFSITELRLVGFIENGGDKLALFKRGDKGTTFTLKLGRLYSPENVQVSNVKGSVQKNKAVVLTQGERKMVFNSFLTNK